MNARTTLSALAVLLLALGCVPSLHPLYSEDDLVTDARLEGTFQEEEGGAERWTFRRKDGDSYELVQVDEDGDEGRLVVHLLRLGAYTFLDFYPNEPAQGMDNDFYGLHVLAAHTFARVDLGDEGIVLSFLDGQWLEDALESGELRLRHEVVDDCLILTEGTEGLQRFALRYADDEDVFPPTRLKRAVSPF